MTNHINNHSLELVKINKLMEYREEIGKLYGQRTDKLEMQFEALHNSLSVLVNRIDTIRQFLHAKDEHFSLEKRL